MATRRPVVDARSKIMAKNRLKIRDARDKLVQLAKRGGDARNKLISKRNKRMDHYYETSAPRMPHHHHPMPAVRHHQLPFTADSRRRPMQQQQQQHHYGAVNDRLMMDIDMDEEEYIPSSISLRRTVQNDIAYTKMPPLPSFQRTVPSSSSAAAAYHRGVPPHQQHHLHQQMQRRPRSPPPPLQSSSSQQLLASGGIGAASLWGSSDPFDCYEVPVGRPADVSEPKHLHRQIRNVGGGGGDMMPRKGILRSSRDRQQPSPPNAHHHHGGGGGGMDDSSHLSYEMRARLQRTPDSNQSMGIFSNPYSKSNQPPPSAVMHGYRIVVSNLHSSVSQSDIKVSSISRTILKKAKQKY